MAFDDVLEVLEFGLMGNINFKRGKWGFLLDGIWLQFEDDASLEGPVNLGLDADLEVVRVQGLITYEVFNHSLTTIDINGGVAWFYLSLDFDAKGGGPLGRSVEGSESESFLDPMMGLDIIRFDDRGQSAEHWDLFTPGVMETSSGRQVYDNAAEFSQPQVTSDATEAFNKRVVYEFLNTAFGRKQYREAAEQYIGDVYYQHNPNAPDGADAFVDFFESGAMTIVYDVHLMLAQNDLVAVYATQWQQRADAEDWTPMSALDLFRVRNSKIVEHWDFIGPVSPPDSFVHINGDF